LLKIETKEKGRMEDQIILEWDKDKIITKDNQMKLLSVLRLNTSTISKLKKARELEENCKQIRVLVKAKTDVIDEG
jgi:hypothetical protein